MIRRFEKDASAWLAMLDLVRREAKRADLQLVAYFIDLAVAEIDSELRTARQASESWGEDPGDGPDRSA